MAGFGGSEPLAMSLAHEWNNNHCFGLKCVKVIDDEDNMEGFQAGKHQENDDIRYNL